MTITESKTGVEQSVVGNEERIGGVCCVGTDKADAKVSANTGKSSFPLGIVDEGTSLIARRLRQPLANIGRSDVINVVRRSKGVAAVKVETTNETGYALKLDAARADLAILMLVEVRVRDEDVCFIDLKDRRGDEAIGGARLYLYAAFNLPSV
jgi:hypothetical protein